MPATRCIGVFWAWVGKWGEGETFVQSVREALPPLLPHGYEVPHQCVHKNPLMVSELPALLG